MMNKDLFKEFKRFQGQPVLVFTDDGRVHRGVSASVSGESVRIVNRHGCMELIDFTHIDAVSEPHMELCRCEKVHCKDHGHNGDLEDEIEEEIEEELEDEIFEDEFRGRRRR